MKIIIILLLGIACGFFGYSQLKSTKKNFSEMLKPDITIGDLKQNSSIFSDSLVELHNLIVYETTAILGYSTSKIADSEGNTMTFISKKSYSLKEKISIKGKLKIVLIKNENKYEYFVAEDLLKIYEKILFF